MIIILLEHFSQLNSVSILTIWLVSVLNFNHFLLFIDQVNALHCRIAKLFTQSTIDLSLVFQIAAKYFVIKIVSLANSLILKSL